MTRILMGSAVRQFPRAILGAVRADADPKTVITDLTKAFGEFRDRHDGRLATVEAALDQLAVDAAMRRTGGPGGSTRHPDDPDYTGLFSAWARGGVDERALREANATGPRSTVNASLSVGSNPDGGYLAPSEWDRQVVKALTVLSPLRRIATIRTTTVRAFTTLWNAGGWGSGWVGETASRPATTTAQLAPLEFAAGEIYANPQATQTLLDDAAFDLEDWISTELATEFEKQESIAFVSGDGVNKPRGFLTYVAGGPSATAHPGGVLSTTNSGAAAQVTPDGLIDAVMKLPAPYRANGTWLMNSLTSAAVSKMKDSVGQYLWQPSLIAGQPSTLLGYPVEISESMPDVAAGALPIAFGDFKRGYLINDRMGVRVLRDPYTAKPYVGFYTTKRVGGGVWDPKAIILVKIAAS